MEKTKFKRNTHDANGNYRQDLREQDLSGRCTQEYLQETWVLHHTRSDKGLTFNEICEEIQRDTTNFSLFDMPKPESVALSLIRCIEDTLVKVINDD